MRFPKIQIEKKSGKLDERKEKQRVQAYPGKKVHRIIKKGFGKMLNKLWGVMLLAGIIVAAFTGKTAEAGTAAIDSSKEAVTLCIAMLGVMSMWTGIMNVAKKAGLIDAMTRALRPVLRFLFPDIPREHVVNEYIAANMIANMLGLGWAATPYGLKTMEQLQELNHGSHIASADMCTFLIINISSLQLIPVNIIAYRSQYGSVSPTSIIGMGLIATLISTAVGVIFASVARKLGAKSGKKTVGKEGAK